MARSNRSSSDLSDIESTWSPPSSVQLSYEEIVAGHEFKELKLQFSSLLEAYGLHNVLNIEDVLKIPFVDPSVSYLPSQFGYALLISGIDLNPTHVNNVGAHLRDFSLEVLVITDPSRNQLIGALLRLVAHAVLHQARAPVIIGYYGPVNDLMLKLNDGVLDLRLIFDLLLLLPTEEIIIPVIDGFDRDVHISLRNELYTKLDQSRRRFILYHAIRSDGPSIFSHLSKELATSRNLKAIMELIDDLSENVSSALAIEDINLSSMHSKEPALHACGCGKCSIYQVCEGKCPRPDQRRSIPLLCKSEQRPDGALDFTHNCTRGESQEAICMIYSLLQSKFCRKLQEVNHSKLVLGIRTFFPRFKEMKSARDDLESNKCDFINRFNQHLINETLWISHKNLNRLKELAKSLGCREVCGCLDMVESHVSTLTDIDLRLVSAGNISYPSFCHHTSMEHYVFIVDEALALLPFTAFDSLHHRVWEKICLRKQTHVFVSFAICHTDS